MVFCHDGIPFFENTTTFKLHSDGASPPFPITQYLYCELKDGAYYSAGHWYECAQSYVAAITEQADRIPLIHLKGHDHLEATYDRWKAAQPGGTKKYREYWYNTVFAKSLGFNVYDTYSTVVGKKLVIEPCDLEKDGCLYFVKIGDPRGFATAVQQATSTLNYLVANERKLSARKNAAAIAIELQPKELALYLIPRRVAAITKLSDLSSFTFLNMAASWYRQASEQGFNPKIVVAAFVE